MSVGGSWTDLHVGVVQAGLGSLVQLRGVPQNLHHGQQVSTVLGALVRCGLEPGDHLGNSISHQPRLRLGDLVLGLQEVREGGEEVRSRSDVSDHLGTIE